MQYKTHVATSVALALPMLSVTNELTLINLGAVAIGSLFPDIDHPRSFLGNKIKILSNVTNKTLGHRGGTHSLLALVGIYCLGNWFAQIYLSSLLIYVPFWFALGYFFHLLEDGFSREGIKLFWPFQNKPWHLGGSFIKYKTGGLKENVFLGFVLALLLVEIRLLWIGRLDSLFSGLFLRHLQQTLLGLQRTLLG